MASVMCSLILLKTGAGLRREDGRRSVAPAVFRRRQAGRLELEVTSGKVEAR